ncbi:hypothetical protein TWF696_004433 [Orbilia brochopaga]|uniref:RRM domain-containing protein n=1 Tax=Orbilia brochopaga TaxID=3140254 RepID=A0AAV9V6B9_9PEZI
MGNVLQRPAGALNSDEYIVLVGNIPWRGRWQDLKDLVREITPGVQRVEIYLTPDGRSRGFGYIIVRDRDEALKVVEHLDGLEWHGRALMAKLGNEANAVPILAQQPTQMSPSEGSPLPDYVPVPPLPTDYSSNANLSAYLNLAPSQLAAYNEWISIQAYYHYVALAHNTNIHIQEERLRSQKQSLIRQEEETVNSSGGLQPSQFVDTEVASAANSSPTRENEAMLEEYRRQAITAQRAAAFHSARHHALLQEELSRFQVNPPLGHPSSSSSSTPSSSSAYSRSRSRRGTPNQPSTNSSTSRSPSKVSSPPPPQQSFVSYYPLTHNQGSGFTNPSSTVQNYPSMAYPSQQTQPFSHPLTQGQGHLPLQPLQTSNMAPIFFNQGDLPLLPSFYPVQSPGNYQYSPPPISPSAGIPPHRHGSFGLQPVQSFHQPQQQQQQQHQHHHHHHHHHHQINQQASIDGHRYQASQVPAAIPPAPLVINNSAGVPVNLTHGAVQTENRGIFIGNLPYNTHWRDLRTFLSSAGNIIRCDVPRKPNNKGRGYATVLFASAEDANRACDMFNGTTFQGRQIRVRLDTYANTKSVEVGGGGGGGGAAGGSGGGAHHTVGSGSAGSASGGGGSGSGGNQSSFFTDGDVERDGVQEDQGCGRSSASV